MPAALDEFPLLRKAQRDLLVQLRMREGCLIIIVLVVLLFVLVGCVLDAMILSPDERIEKCYDGQTEYCMRT